MNIAKLNQVSDILKKLDIILKDAMSAYVVKNDVGFREEIQLYSSKSEAVVRILKNISGLPINNNEFLKLKLLTISAENETVAGEIEQKRKEIQKFISQLEKSLEIEYHNKKKAA